MPNTTSDHGHSLTYPSEGATSWFATIVAYHQAVTDNLDSIGTTEITLIDDASGNEMLSLTQTASAVNYVDLTNAAAAGAPTFTAAGDDTNIDLALAGKGTGAVELSGLKYPVADGSEGYAIITDGSGTLSIGHPDIEYVRDDNNNEIVVFTGVASAVNYLEITSGATTDPVLLEAKGDDTNVGISIQPKGSGQITLDAMTFPATAGTSGQMLESDGAGNLIWGPGADLVNDTSPQLGGDLDPNGYGVAGNWLPAVDETYNLGSSTLAWQDLYAKRLSFDDGTNQLTNYQVGTWTPTIGGLTSDPTGVTYTVQEGYYVYIGPLVHAWFNIEFSSYSTGGSGSAYIEGLPANCMNDADYIPIGFGWNYDSASGRLRLIEVLYNTDRIFIHSPTGSGTSRAYNPSALSLGGASIEDLNQFTGHIVYRSA